MPTVSGRDKKFFRPATLRSWRSTLICWVVLLVPGIANGEPEVERAPNLTAEDEVSPLEKLRQSLLGQTWDQLWIPQSRLGKGKYIRAAFRNVTSELAATVVEVRDGQVMLAIGGVVGADGWILTKASAVRGVDIMTCRFADKTERIARIVGIHRDSDLAMLKVDMAGAKYLELAADNAGEVGDWVATVGPRSTPLAVGVVSVGSRKIPNRFGILGVRLEGAEAGPRVVQVFPRTGADEAGILVNDVIREIEGEIIPDRQALVRKVRQYSAGDLIELAIDRAGQIVSVKAVLGERFSRARSREMEQEGLDGAVSRRRFDFPQALQHDTILQPSQCGGPIINLDGEVVGFNIARAGRTESYAIPTEAILPLLYQLMSGNMAP